MSRVSQVQATLDDLYSTSGKAELIGGRIVRFMASGEKPSRVAFRIAIPELPSGRESFSPDASYYDGPLPADPMRFIEGPPKFAAEVRSQNDYGDPAEAEMSDKRAEYFAAGTLVVWDVDPLAECIHVYRSNDPTTPITYVRGQVAEAEPSVPGWRVWVFA